MSLDVRVADHGLSFDQIDIDDFIKESRRAGLNAPQKSKPRSRRKDIKRNLSKASLIAPLLAAEGCLTLGKEEVPLGGGESAGSESDFDASDGGGDGAPSPGNSSPSEFVATSDHLDVAPNEPLSVSAEQLLANDIHGNNDSLELVRVFGAVNGTVVLDAGIVTFIPEQGFEGAAQFSYEVRDQSGETRVGDVFVDVESGVVTVSNDESDAANSGSGDQQDGEAGGGDAASSSDSSDDAGAGDTGQSGHGDHSDGASEDGGHVHPDDPSKAAEHSALLDLAPVAEATHVAVSNGSWFDPSTWAGGAVPGDGAKVHIPHGVAVNYDGESAASIFTVRVDGMLHFATNQDTFMEVDTLIVTPSGHMTVGTTSNPVAPGVNAVIQIADNGPIDVSWDPMLLSRGVISHGSLDVHGAEKDTFVKLATDPMAGDTSITLEETPEGWNVGDRLVLTGTHYTEPPPAGAPEGTAHPQLYTEDEELIITSISGNVVQFATPLEFDHDTPRGDLKAYVANYSRNVQVLTENADGVPTHQRGHVMAMHSDDIDVRYAEFFELGRTDKSERAFDAGDLDSVASDSNVKGRYSLHIHRAGVTDSDDPAMLVGNAVWGSPGWGYVHHDSNAVLADNAAYDVSGAAFVAETGNETGRWAHNIAIKSIGVKGLGNFNTPKVTEDVQAFDLGRTGAGFYFQGRMVDSVDNVAAGVPGGQGFVYFHRGPGQIDITPDIAPHPEALGYRDAVQVNVPSISMFHNNETIASGGGLVVIKQDPTQDHDMRSVISDFTAWEVRYGAHLGYTAHYTFKNADFIGAADQSIAGVNLGTNVVDFVINGADISGFETGVRASRHLLFEAEHEYIFIDTNVSGAATPFENAGAAHGDTILTGADLVEGRLTFDSVHSNMPEIFVQTGGDGVSLAGVKTDSIGQAETSPDWDPHFASWPLLQNAAAEEGFWRLPDGRAVLAVEQYYADRATGALVKESELVVVEGIFSPDMAGWFEANGYPYNGVLDLDNSAADAVTDFATVSENGSVIVDVLANDIDPDGDDLAVDGFIYPKHGDVHVNDDGTVTYTPDPNFVGEDHLCYWVDDGQGHLTMGELYISVEI